MYQHAVAGTAAIALITPFLILLGAIESNAQASAAGTAQEINGNWYCSEVNAISYTDFPGNGSYNKVTNMDAATGQCSFEQYGYSGSLSPLNEELSLHVRGPTWLKQVAVYTFDTSSNSKRNAKRNTHGRRHAGHQYLHGHHGKVKEVRERQHEHDYAKRSVGELVSATIDGQLVSWTNMYAGPGVATILPSPAVSPIVAQFDEMNDSSPATTNVANAEPPMVSPTAATSSLQGSPIIAASSAMASSEASSGAWTRQAYYNAADGTSQGITFLNHFGGVNGLPGTSAGGAAFGTSLSYASSDSQTGAASPQTLSNAVIEDDVEVIIMSDNSCDDGSCGYTRPGGVAYHGFSGSLKVFLLEFSMPYTNTTGFNADMPAIWLMNAQIPLTSQYGENPDCSCWTSGCGEFDLFEILDSGNFRCKSTLHMAPAGGSSDWFMRPTGDSITAAVIFAGSNEVAAIRILDQGQSFDKSLSGSVINSWVQEQSSLFSMSE
ncbi:hypothetical protein JMJ35_002054 [Cladonia borealis]|uniref:glucan endo-1,3-beta-D-glucosidase n=1 Tax=Cladonia borealis TaxID=184061 RepID=A0AA39R929_9LECA|nr:hypothetical protein JMJ35_002054 [Cladonia borealis]